MNNSKKTIRFATLLMILGISSQLFGQNKDSDRIYIKKDTINGVLHSIFIDNNKESIYYDAISNFEFDKYDEESYQYSLDNLKKQNLTIKKVPPIIPWKKWVPVYQYKGNLYVYHPCDFMFDFRVSLNDSTFIFWTGEGPIAKVIESQRKVDSLTYEFILNKSSSKFIIHILDKENHLAYFEDVFIPENGELMIPIENMRSLPIIVNDCTVQKQLEFNFEDLDFEALMNSSKK